MDHSEHQHHTQTEQLPDENYIERLFPKCPPKQAMLPPTSFNRRSLRLNRDSNQLNRKQTRSKVHQHSRRELEARRNKIPSTLIGIRKTNGNSSESSDDEKKNNVQAGENNDNVIKKSPSSSFVSRKSGKYAASQSLLQQLQRSQSSYNNTIGASSSSSSLANNPSDHHKANNNNKHHDTDKITNAKNEIRGATGIVKSVSSFAFTESSSKSSKSNNAKDEQSSNHGSSNADIEDVLQKQHSVNTELHSLNDDTLRNDNDSQGDLQDLYKNDADFSNSRSNSRRVKKETTSNSTSCLISSNDDTKFNNCLKDALEFTESNLSTVTPKKFKNFQEKHAIDNKPTDYLTLDSNITNTLSDLAPITATSSQTADFIHNQKSPHDSSKKRPTERENELLLDSVRSKQSASLNNDQLLTRKTNKRRSLNDIKEKVTFREEDALLESTSTNNSIEHQKQTKTDRDSKNQLGSDFIDYNKSDNHRSSSRSKRSSDRGLIRINDDSLESAQEAQKQVKINREEDCLARAETKSLINEETESILQRPANEKQTSQIVNSSSLGTSQNLDHHSQIVSIGHQASQQLLSFDLIENEDDTVRNDASTEELFNGGDDVEDTVTKDYDKLINSKNQRSDNLGSKKEECEVINSRYTKSSKLIATNEPNITSKNQDSFIQEDLITDEEVLENSTIRSDTFETMPSHQSKRMFTPPGHPHRIRPKPDNELSSFESNDKNSTSLNLIHSDLKELSSNSSSPSSGRYSNSHIRTNTSDVVDSMKVETQRVKFDEENLVKFRDNVDLQTLGYQCSENNEQNLPLPVRQRNELVPQMPSISEVENEIDQNRTEQPEKELCTGMKRVHIGNSSYSSNLFTNNNGEQTKINSSPENINQPHELKDISPANLLLSESHKINDIGQTAQSNDSRSSQDEYPLHSSKNQPLLDTHVTARCSSTSSGDAIKAPIRSSSIQFSTLSDGESGDELIPPTEITDRGTFSNRHMTNSTVKRCDTIGNRFASTGSSSSKNDDDLATPTTKTALIFPRLDEGLSSDAESCDDDVEDDDERAMEADVDADDDEDDDDDEDVDDEDENDEEVETHGASQSRVVNYIQQQQAKPSNRTSTSLSQQHNTSISNITPDHSDLHHQMKSSGSSYGNYIGHESLEHNDLKPSVNNYHNQNGQPGYWMNSPSSHQMNLSSQPVSSQQQFTQRSNNQVNNTISKNNASFNREEAKATSRLSSDTDNETDRLLGSQRNDQLKATSNDISSNNTDIKQISNVIKQTASSREVLIEGVLFNVKYLGSTHTDCEGRSEKEDRIHQAEMAVHEVKFRNGESQSATEVQLFISTEKIMVLDDKQRKIMMDHSLRTISYIADIGDAIVLIVRKKNSSNELANDLGRPISKISCHVFESSESHTITKSISQAFQVAYTELLKANGAGDGNSYLPKELDYQEVLNSQEMSTDELEMFARKENQREVVVPKKKGEILGLSIVESGWGSVLPTVVIANLKQDGPAYNCKKLAIGDQILSVNGVSLVGLPLADCQEILRKTKNHRVAKLSVVPCPVTVEVKIKRPDTKYQLGFSVQNGVICSLLRGGIAERGGVRVGHRIMSINGTTVVGVPHEKIVTLLASSVGEIRMKTCLTSLYRLMLGEENPVHF